jgi:hypothetical protein
MKRNLLLLMVTLALAVTLTKVTPAGAILITFTGDVEADFPAFAIYNDQGGVGDVGVPPAAPAGTSIGWDLESVGLAYEASTDTLYVGFNAGNGAISGDADGDGDPGQTCSWLNTLMGSDLADLEATEALDILIDVDQSCELGSAQASDYEAVAGITNSGGINEFAVSTFSQLPNDFTTPGAGYLLPQYSGSVFASPGASQPDLEFQINDFCASILSLAGSPCTPGVTPISFAFRARAGSAADDGIGEDAIACTDVNYTPTAITLSDVRARPAVPLAWTGIALLLLVVTASTWMRARYGRRRP